MSFGVDVRTRTAQAARGAVGRTDKLFLCGPAASVTSGRVDLRSIADFEAAVGLRNAGTTASWDAVQTYFRAGGKQCTFAPYATDYGDALALIDDPKYGPGQLVVLGEPPGATLYSDMQAACQANNRVALRDVTQDAAVTQLETDGGTAPANDEYGATFGPWLTVPPPPGVVGANPREIPGSIAIAALCALVDADGNPNRAAAGDDYPLQYATGMTLDISATDRAALFQAGVNAFDDTVVLENYGFQTNKAQDVNDPYWQFNCSRARMALVDRSTLRARPFMFRPLDGRGRLEGELQADLEDECNKLFLVDAMYGDTPQDAYDVNVTSSVNTVDTIAQGELHAVASVVWTLHAISVEVDLVTVPLGSPV
jgi:hypothetical protein